MIKSTILRFGVFVIFITLISCQNQKLKKVQGVFTVDKISLQNSLQEKMGTNTAFAEGLMNMAIKNAVIEFKVKDDSIRGLVFLVGQTAVLNSKIEVHNDSLVAMTKDFRVYIIPNEKGFLYKNGSSGVTLQMIKSEQTDLSSETKQAMEKQIQTAKELEKFIESLGKWQSGYYVDEFQDKTGEGYAFCLVSGNHQTSTIPSSEVYVKAFVSGKKIVFEIYNSSMSFKENFPNEKFGSIKIKFPDGKVENEQVFFYENTASESEGNIIYDYLLKNDGELKILIDLSTASDYYSDKYHFSLQKKNLNEILTTLKK